MIQMNFLVFTGNFPVSLAHQNECSLSFTAIPVVLFMTACILYKPTLFLTLSPESQEPIIILLSMGGIVYVCVCCFPHLSPPAPCTSGGLAMLWSKEYKMKMKCKELNRRANSVYQKCDYFNLNSWQMGIFTSRQE